MLACFTERRERHGGEANSWPPLYALLACISGTFLQEQLGSSPLERALSHLEVGEKWVGEERQQARRSESHFICVRWQDGKLPEGNVRKKKKVGYTPKHIRAVCAKKMGGVSPRILTGTRETVRVEWNLQEEWIREASKLTLLLFFFFFLLLWLQFPPFSVTRNQVLHMKTLGLWAWNALWRQKGFPLRSRGPFSTRAHVKRSNSAKSLPLGSCSEAPAAPLCSQHIRFMGRQEVTVVGQCYTSFQLKHWHCCGGD